MSPEEIYSVARSVGFPPEVATSMVAIAWRESGGNPNAFNGKPPDMSYGLWQINMLGSLGPARRAQFGLSSNEELFDPYTNARAAYAIWNGDNANLARHWYIDRGVYRDRYNQFLPMAQDAAAAVEGIDAPGIQFLDDGGMLPGGDSTLLVGGGLLLLALLFVMSD